MKLIFIALAVLLAGCEQQDGPRPTIGKSSVSAGYAPLEVSHDDLRQVTCWSKYGGSQTLSCIPDWMLTGPRRGVQSCGSKADPSQECRDERGEKWPGNQPRMQQ